MQTKMLRNYQSFFPIIKPIKKEVLPNFEPTINPSGVEEILVITSYPPRECGIATYSQDLIVALNNKFEKSFSIKICALENQLDTFKYDDAIAYILKTDTAASYAKLAQKIHTNLAISMVLIQHEFGLFKNNEADFLLFLQTIQKPVAVVFHTVLPHPNAALLRNVQSINQHVQSIIVMTNTSAKILIKDYGVAVDKITIIPHGTHLVAHTNKTILKQKYQLENRKIVATFGLLSSGKSIETSINALKDVVKQYPDILFLIIGKTHPNVVKQEGEKYRKNLKATITALQLDANVLFINEYLPLNTLLDYLQLTDIYLFTSKDRNQAVSGTFSYAISCGCPIISTPIPHAVEVLQNQTGIIIDFENAKQLAKKIALLFDNEPLRKKIATKGIHKLAPTAWENSAIAHALLFQKISKNKLKLQYKLPPINLNHFKNLTTNFGMIQFSVINQPDIKTGYTLDDNARALVAICQHFELYNHAEDLEYIYKYYHFIQFCLQANGTFLNYVCEDKKFTKQNNENLADSNGRAIWALGYLISLAQLLPKDLIASATITFQLALTNVYKIHSPRAMAFIIKGIFYSNTNNASVENNLIVQHLAHRLAQMYLHESDTKWQWFESYLTYANSILPEAMLCAFLVTKKENYKEIAKKSFDFLLTKTFKQDNINVISNKGWLHNNKPYKSVIGGEQPIDVAYTIMALSKFFDIFNQEEYATKMQIAFNWFLGKNHLHQIVYNPCTGGCYDGLEDTYLNLNQGAESTVSYLMARLTLEKHLNKKVNTANVATNVNVAIT